MCYSEFNNIIDAIGTLDADVISIETARSKMELLDAFITHRYPNEIGPGVYDIHAPRCPSVDEMAALLDGRSNVFRPIRYGSIRTAASRPVSRKRYGLPS